MRHAGRPDRAHAAPPAPARARITTDPPLGQESPPRTANGRTLSRLGRRSTSDRPVPGPTYAPRREGDDVGDGPVLVFGAQRSGTTLLRLMLDAHPNIAIGPETGFLRRIGEAAQWPAVGRSGVPWSDGWSVDPETVEREFALAFERVFAAHAAAQGARRWGEKTPLNASYGERLARLWPDAQVVTIVRHPVPVVRSRARWGPSHTPPRVLENWAKVARNHVRNRAVLGSERFHLVRFEDLVSSPRPVMEEVLAFLGEPWHPDVLRHHDIAGEAEVTDGGNRTDQPVDPDRATAWTADVTDEELAIVEQVCGTEIGWFGYRTHPAQPVVALPPDALAGVAVPDTPVPAAPAPPATPPDPAPTPTAAVTSADATARVRSALRRRGLRGPKPYP